MIDQEVEIEGHDGTLSHGKLAAVTGDSVVLVDAQGKVSTLLKSDAAALRVPPVDVLEDGAAEPIAPAAPSPNKASTDKSKPKGPKKHLAPDEFPKLALYTAHGLAWGHWNADGYKVGAAAYALDFAAGYNFRKDFAVLALLGGTVGANLGKRSDQAEKANYGHFAPTLRYQRKYWAFMGGLGVGWTRIKESSRVVRYVGVAVPLRLMAQIRLRKHMVLGLGVGYEIGIFGRGRVFNSPSLHIALARW